MSSSSEQPRWLPLLQGTTSNEPQIRDAAKWLLAAFAGIFAALTGGLQFASISKTTELLNAGMALVFSALAITASLFVILQAARLLADFGLTADELLTKETRARVQRGTAERDPDSRRNHPLRRDVMDWDKLLHAIKGERALSTFQEDELLPSKLVFNLKTARQRLARKPDNKRLQTQTTDAANDLGLLLWAANKYHFTRKFERLILSTTIAAILIPACIIGFAWATLPAGPSSSPVSQVIGVRVIFGSLTDKSQLGFPKECTLKEVQGLMVGGTLAEPLVVSTPTANCPAAKFLVTKAVGIALPMVK